jgi:hypothetical protein
MNMHRTLLVWSFLAASMAASAQDDSTHLVPYYGGFDLHDGVYFGFPAFRNNSPSVPIERLRDQGAPVKDIRRVVSKLTWQPDTGAQQTIRKEKLWGFCQNDAVYIAAGNGFYRIGLMGSLAHMVYELSYRDWDPYMYPYGGTTRTVLVQQKLNMDTGEFLPFNAAGMDRALLGDPVLLEEFRALSKKQRNSDEAVFRFLRLYNERHPLLFPR